MGLKKTLYLVINKTLYGTIKKIQSSGHIFGHVTLKDTIFKHLPYHLNTYIDIGAFDGYFYDIVAREKKIKNVILIEPQTNSYAELRKKYQHNNNIKIYKCFLSNKAEDRTFYYNKLESTSSFFEFNNDVIKGDLDQTRLRKEIITTNTLDNILQNYNEHIDLMKIDVQGAELLVLEGSTTTLKYINFIWIEVSFKKIYNDIPTFEDIQRWLNKNNFQLIEILPGYRNASGELLQADCLFKKISNDIL